MHSLIMINVTILNNFYSIHFSGAKGHYWRLITCTWFKPSNLNLITENFEIKIKKWRKCKINREERKRIIQNNKKGQKKGNRWVICVFVNYNNISKK